MNKIIVTMTSWIGRMKYDISPTIISLLTGTLKPDILYLNLSTEEWSGNDLPEYISKLQEEYSNFVVNWVDGPNTKTFKKLLPILENHKDDIIFTVDDDVTYYETYLEDMYNDFMEDPTRPLTAHYCQRNGVLFVWGGASVYKYEFLEGYKDLLDDEVISTYEDDWFYSYVILRNHLKVRLPHRDEMCYTPWRFPQYRFENSMTANKMYDTNRTREILDRKLVELGTSFEELSDIIWEKYGHRVV